MSIKQLFTQLVHNARLKKALKPYFHKKSIKKILSGKYDTLNRLTEREIDFILIKTNTIDNNQNNQQIFPENVVTMREVIETAAQYGTVDIYSTIIVLYINWPEKKFPYSMTRQDIAKEFLSIWENKISIVHGHCTCLCGMIGSFSMFRFGVILPDIFTLFSQLDSIGLGEMTEYPQ